MYVTDVTDIYMSKNGRYLIDAVFDGESHGGLRFASFCCLHVATKHIIYMPAFLTGRTPYYFTQDRVREHVRERGS